MDGAGSSALYVEIFWLHCLQVPRYSPRWEALRSLRLLSSARPRLRENRYVPQPRDMRVSRPEDRAKTLPATLTCMSLVFGGCVGLGAPIMSLSCVRYPRSITSPGVHRLDRVMGALEVFNAVQQRKVEKRAYSIPRKMVGEIFFSCGRE